MKTLIARTILAVCLLGALPAWAAGSLFQHSTGGAVHLRWNAPLGEAFDGFYVERQSASGGDWLRLTDTPVQPLRDVQRIRELLGPDADAFLTFFDPGMRTIAPADFNKVMGDPFARALIQLYSVKIPAMGEVLGEIYVDRDMTDGEAFRYRVLRSDDSSVWAESAAAITHGQPDSVPVPVDFRGEGAESSALLTWKHDAGLSRSGTLVAYRIYRADSPTGPFLPASYESIVPTRVNGEYPEFLYTDQYLDNGRPYWFRLAGVNVLGFEGPPSASIKVVPKDQTRPPAPQHLRARRHGDGALLQWDPVTAEDLEGYRVYRGEQANGPFHLIWPEENSPPLPRISFVEETIPEGSAYYYFAVAVDLSRNESLPSDSVQVFREDRTPPARVTGVKALAVGDGDQPGVHLSWAASKDADLSGYFVQRSTRINGRGKDAKAENRFFGENIRPLEVAQYIDPVPKDSESRYAYRIVAADKAGNRSEPSEVVIARMPDKVPPTRPAIRFVRMRDGKVAVAWQANVEEDLAGYRVYRSRDDQRFDPLNKELLGDLEFLDQPKDFDTVFHYRVTAVDETGNESPASQSMSVKFRDTEAPPPPEITRIDVADGGLRLHWAAAAADVLNIVVNRQGPEESEPRVLVYLEKNARDYLDREVEDQLEYRYTLRVIDERENISAPSAEQRGRFQR